MSGVSRLKFKGDKTKKKRKHRERPADGDRHDDLEALAAADPTGWMFPASTADVSGPTVVVFPTDPPTCLAWDPSRSRVVAAPLDLPSAPEGAPDLSPAEQLALAEPSDVNHVWVVSRLAGSSGVSLRCASGSFLSALPSGKLDVSASRGPLESFLPDASESGFSLRSEPSGKFLLCAGGDREAVLARKAELRCDADDAPAGVRAKCQREFVLKARIGEGGKRAAGTDAAGREGSAEDELKRSTEYQAWGGGVHRVADGDRRELKKARKEGRVAEAMLDRRAKMKSDKYC